MAGNRFMIWLLRSPLHSLVSKHVILITLTGRKSGKTYDVPVNYARDGQRLWVTSYRQRSWWRNLVGVAPVGVLLAGQRWQGQAEAIIDEGRVGEGLLAYLSLLPSQAKYFDIGLDPDGRPLAEDCAKAAKERVIVRIDLSP